MWLDGPSDVLRILLVGVSGYVALVAALRLSGKRTLAKLNAFDLVVTVALGSVLVTVLLDSRTSLTDGIVGIFVLVSCQAVVATVTSRMPHARSVVTARPAVVLVDGHPDVGVMRRHRLGMDELRQAVRGAGAGDLSRVGAVVLETDGTLSVILSSDMGDRSALPHADPTARGGRLGARDPNRPGRSGH